jgi:hypothetical protein
MNVKNIHISQYRLSIEGFTIFKLKGTIKVYSADHTSTTLKLSLDASTSKIISSACEALGLNETNRLILCEVKSNGGKQTT